MLAEMLIFFFFFFTFFFSLFFFFGHIFDGVAVGGGFHHHIYIYIYEKLGIPNNWISGQSYRPIIIQVQNFAKLKYVIYLHRNFSPPPQINKCSNHSYMFQSV